MLGIVAIAFGIGMLIGLIYLTIRYIIPGSILLLQGTWDILKLWGKALKQGWDSK
ncbi:hypothetical protein M7775_02025 [Sporomusa sphaeroides DSM 2875]|uniref:hypothetical protein n=1 Tax=Sporomusa sphaeroides TaxID=47679 RepID=UPI0020307FF3|nr:hypothetical protein [Sporomusa sphaeroides]MCM0757345.1 hypothetical protein [Sporomusa sphaeroides DSM 2875]